MSVCEKCGATVTERPALWAFFTLGDAGRPAIRRFCRPCSDAAERLVLDWLDGPPQQWDGLEEKEPVRADTVPAGS